MCRTGQSLPRVLAGTPLGYAAWIDHRSTLSEREIGPCIYSPGFVNRGEPAADHGISPFTSARFALVRFGTVALAVRREGKG
jgi:hypothetical protein